MYSLQDLSDKFFDKVSTNKALFALFLVGSLAAILVGVYWMNKYQSVVVKGDVETVEFVGGEGLVEKEEEERRYSVVLAGRGGDGHAGGTLADSIIVLTANLDTKKATFITVPRDLWVPIPHDWENKANYKINAAYNIGLDNVRYANKKPEFRGSEGAGNLLGHVAGEVVGIPIDYFAVVDFDRFKNLIDTLGGITVEVPETFADNFYPVKGLENETCGFSNEKIADVHAKYSGFQLEKQFTCRYETIAYDKGPADLTGDMALKFVRSRHGDSDFGRSKRQIAVLEGIAKKLVSLDAVKKGSKLLKDLSEMVDTNMGLSAMGTLIDIIGNPQEYETERLYITEDNLVNSSKASDGQYILLPKAGNNNFSGIKSYIQENI